MAASPLMHSNSEDTLKKTSTNKNAYKRLVNTNKAELMEVDLFQQEEITYIAEKLCIRNQVNDAHQVDGRNKIFQNNVWYR